MTNNYLTFLLDSNVCAVEISHVLEVLNYGNFTAIPCSEPYIEGLIYSREQGITVINLRKKFNLKIKDSDVKTKIIVITITKETDEGEKSTLYGLVADQVLDVQAIDDENMVNTAVKSSIPKTSIEKILKHNDKNIFVLNVTDL